MFRVVVFALLLFPLATFASLQYSELLVKNEKGEMLKQVSGLARFNDWIVVLVQDENAIYVAKENTLANAFYEPKSTSINLTPIKIKMDQLQTVSWEAVEFASVNGTDYIFLFHEHDFDGDNHQVYFSEVKTQGQSFRLSKLKPLGQALPILQNEGLSLSRRENYGYEAIIWDPLTERLLLLPELKTQQKIALDLNGKQTMLEMATHELRASDVTSVSNQCALVTSFCYQSNGFSDVLCSGNNGSPKLSLASFSISKSGLTQRSSKDLTEQLMSVGYAPDYTGIKEGARTFNIEGIVNFQNGFLVANDNIPQSKARTVLRYVTGINVNPDTCALE